MRACWMRGLGLGLLILGLTVEAALAANEGVILSLSAIGASQPGDPIQISSSVQALARIQNSNLFYTVSAPSGALVAQRTLDLGQTAVGQVIDDSWSTSNTPETGSYTVTLCWSTGNAQNCDITSASTQFYSVPTLGWPLTAFGFGLIGLWLWRNRKTLALAEAR